MKYGLGNIMLQTKYQPCRVLVWMYYAWYPLHQICKNLHQTLLWPVLK